MLRTDRAEYRVRRPGGGHRGHPGAAARHGPAAGAAHVRRCRRRSGPRCGPGPGWPWSAPAGSAPNSPPRAAARGCQVTVRGGGGRPARRGARRRGRVGDRALVRRRPGWTCGWASRWNPVQPGGLALPGGGWLAADLIGHRGRASGRRWAGWPAPGCGWSNGVAVDGRLRASVPGVFAAGDCAAFCSAPVRPPAAGRALGHRAARARGGGGQHPRRRRDVRPGAVLLVGAVRPDGPVRRAPRRAADRLVWRGDPAGRDVGGVLAGGPGCRGRGRGAAGRAAHGGAAPGSAPGRGASSRRAARSIPAASPTRASRSATPCPPAPDDAVPAGT